LALVVLLLAVFFARQGGIFSATDLRALEQKEAASKLQAVKLQREVDSLALFADSLERVPAVQERVARESFGMLRPGELIFTISAPAAAPRDSAGR
jgi:cell division protein FtsB